MLAHWLLTVQAGVRYRPTPQHLLMTWETSHCDRDRHVVAEVAEGDDVALLRSGSSGGIVAHGRAIAVLARHELDGRANCTPHRVRVQFEATYLGNPVPLGALPGVDSRTRNRYTRMSAWGRPPLELTDDAWQVLQDAAWQERDHVWPTSWEIQPGTAVSRADVHQAYGGQRQGVIVHSALTPNTFVFLGAGSSSAPFTHQWSEDGALLMVGKPEEVTDAPAGNTGVTSAENRYITTHLRAGYPVRVFHSRGRQPCLYLGEVVIDQDNPVEGWIEVTPDETRRRPSRRERVVAYPGGMRPPSPKRLYAPLLRVHPVTGINAFLAPDRAPRRRRQTLRLGVSHTPVTASPVTTTASDTEVIRRAAHLLLGEPDRGQLLNLVDSAALADVISRHYRRQGLDELRRLIRDPGTKERALQRVLEQQSWVFGGDYMGLAARRALSLRDQLDIPLIRGDGTLHGVEIKRAYEPKLIEVHRGRPVAGTPVHLAVVQAMNYLRSLDEQRAVIQDEYGVDCRRTSMTVVIGDPAFVREQFTPVEIAEALRTYNAHLSRIKVITYAELLGGAERSLQLAQPAARPPRRT